LNFTFGVLVAQVVATAKLLPDKQEHDKLEVCRPELKWLDLL
jgi:hypothetical protein